MTATTPPQVFDRRQLRRQRERAATGMSGYDFLYREASMAIAERLSMVKKTFPVVLDIGSPSDFISDTLMKRNGTETVFAGDLSWRLMQGNPAHIPMVLDEEFFPFAEASLDAVFSNLSLHWVNDLPGALAQISRALRPDGLFMCAVLGGGSLVELRTSLMHGEIAASGGASPRVSPLLDLRDMGALMQRAGFALPVIDSEVIVIDYQSPLHVMRDLRGMGAANATHNRPRHMTARAVMLEAAKYYTENFSTEDGRVKATFEIIYAIGWKPDASQQQPLKRGSGQVNLVQILGKKSQ